MHYMLPCSRELFIRLHIVLCYCNVKHFYSKSAKMIIAIDSEVTCNFRQCRMENKFVNNHDRDASLEPGEVDDDQPIEFTPENWDEEDQPLHPEDVVMQTEREIAPSVAIAPVEAPVVPSSGASASASSSSSSSRFLPEEVSSLPVGVPGPTPHRRMSEEDRRAPRRVSVPESEASEERRPAAAAPARGPAPPSAPAFPPLAALETENYIVSPVHKPTHNPLYATLRVMVNTMMIYLAPGDALSRQPTSPETIAFNLTMGCLGAAVFSDPEIRAFILTNLNRGMFWAQELMSLPVAAAYRGASATPTPAPAPSSSASVTPPSAAVSAASSRCSCAVACRASWSS